MKLEIAKEISARLWEITGEISALPGERDLNFKITSDQCSVLKVYEDNPENRALLSIQDRALKALSAKIPGRVPRPVANSDGATVLNENGKLIRLLSWLEGSMWANCESVDRELIENLGKTIALVDLNLAEIELTREENEILNRPFIWNILQVDAILQWAKSIPNEEIKSLVISLVTEKTKQTQEKLKLLPRQLIHNDGNDWNIVVSERNLGLIDFGDMIIAPKIVGIAVAGAYLAMKSDDPSKDIAHLIRGYHGVKPLTSLEVELLFDLVKLRVASSIANAVLQSSANPDNEYLNVSQADAPRTLKLLCNSNSQLALYKIGRAHV